jgi:hypothetical protein
LDLQIGIKLEIAKHLFKNKQAEAEKKDGEMRICDGE